MLRVLTDTCFWLGLLDSRDQHHDTSQQIADLIDGHKVIIPWPCLYETISSRFIGNRDRVTSFETLLKRPEIELLDDSEYKNRALEEVFTANRYRGNTYSLVDGVIREILKDEDIRIEYLVTFNTRDFSDVCQIRQVHILPE